jgi:two-component system nitrogen regulation response regulator NtrX
MDPPTAGGGLRRGVANVCAVERELVPERVGRPILIAEGYDDLRQILELILVDEGLRVVAAADAAALLERGRDQGPWAAIIVDLLLPPGGARAPDLLRELRRVQPEAPIVATTLCDAPAHLVSVREGGADAVLVKPYDVDRLFEALAEARATARSRRFALANQPGL